MASSDPVREYIIRLTSGLIRILPPRSPIQEDTKRRETSKNTHVITKKDDNQKYIMIPSNVPKEDFEQIKRSLPLDKDATVFLENLLYVTNKQGFSRLIETLGEFFNEDRIRICYNEFEYKNKVFIIPPKNKNVTYIYGDKSQIMNGVALSKTNILFLLTTATKLHTILGKTIPIFCDNNLSRIDTDISVLLIEDEENGTEIRISKIDRDNLHIIKDLGFEKEYEAVQEIIKTFNVDYITLTNNLAFWTINNQQNINVLVYPLNDPYKIIEKK